MCRWREHEQPTGITTRLQVSMDHGEKPAVRVVIKEKQLSTISSPICNKASLDELLNTDITFRNKNPFVLKNATHLW